MKKKNAIWIITGAARGFGQQISKAVLATGDTVIATVRSRPEELKAQLGNHPNLHVALLDITNEDQARNVAAEVVKNFGRIDVLVNNAGSGLLSAIEEATAEPPVHLPLGNDALTRYRAKTTSFEKQIAEWHDVITGTTTMTLQNKQLAK